MSPIGEVRYLDSGLFYTRESIANKLQVIVYSGSIEEPVQVKRFIIVGSSGHINVIETESCPCVHYLHEDMKSAIERIESVSLAKIAGK